MVGGHEPQYLAEDTKYRAFAIQGSAAEEHCT